MHLDDHRARQAFIVALFAAACGAAWAGRPLAVDDANVNDAGDGQVELWATRVPGSTVFSIAPAYAVVDGVELGALLSRERGQSGTDRAVQAKWRITPSRDRGCNAGAVLGVTHARDGGGNATYLNGLLSCNGSALGSAHFNLGTVKARGASTVGTWGVAIEKTFGPVTPNIEWFGSEGAKPTAQIGLRGDIAGGVQLDGSIGRGDGQTITTLGLKVSF